jgi:hypothetical protein
VAPRFLKNLRIPGLGASKNKEFGKRKGGWENNIHIDLTEMFYESTNRLAGVVFVMVISHLGQDTNISDQLKNMSCSKKTRFHCDCILYDSLHFHEHCLTHALISSLFTSLCNTTFPCTISKKTYRITINSKFIYYMTFATNHSVYKKKHFVKHLHMCNLETVIYTIIFLWKIYDV